MNTDQCRSAEGRDADNAPADAWVSDLLREVPASMPANVWARMRQVIGIEQQLRHEDPERDRKPSASVNQAVTSADVEIDCDRPLGELQDSEIDFDQLAANDMSDDV